MFQDPELKNFTANPDLSHRKSMKTGNYPQLENALLFFKQQRALGKPISGSLLKEKTNIFQEKITTDVVPAVDELLP